MGTTRRATEEDHLWSPVGHHFWQQIVLFGNLVCSPTPWTIRDHATKPKTLWTHGWCGHWWSWWRGDILKGDHGRKSSQGEKIWGVRKLPMATGPYWWCTVEMRNTWQESTIWVSHGCPKTAAGLAMRPVWGGLLCCLHTLVQMQLTEWQWWTQLNSYNQLELRMHGWDCRDGMLKSCPTISYTCSIWHWCQMQQRQCFGWDLNNFDLPNVFMMVDEIMYDTTLCHHLFKALVELSQTEEVWPGPIANHYYNCT